MGTVTELNEDCEYVATCPECGGESWTILSDRPGTRKNAVLIGMRCRTMLNDGTECGYYGTLTEEEEGE